MAPSLVLGGFLVEGLGRHVEDDAGDFAAFARKLARAQLEVVDGVRLRAARTGIADPGYDRAAILDHLTAALYNSAHCPAHDADFHAAELLNEFPSRANDLDIAAEAALTGCDRRRVGGRGGRSDLHGVRPPSPRHVSSRVFGRAIVRESRRYPVSTLHPRWRAELAALPATVVPGAWQLRDWADRNAVDHHAALTAVLKVLRFLGTLPKLQPLLPLPGEHQHAAVEPNTADAKRSTGCARCWPS